MSRDEGKMNIKLKNITKSFENKIVLNKLNVEIKEQNITCIMGPSGIGKTTLINILMGLVKADEGTVEGLEGKKIAAVFQEDRLCESIDAIKNVQLVCQKDVTSKIRNEFELVGLTDYENKPISVLSGGMKRRVAIVRALIADSDVIIMDEPFKGLDDEIKHQVVNYIINKTRGKTVIIVTHDKENVTSLSAELICL